MPQAQIDALVARLSSDPQFARSLAQAASEADAVRVAAEHGIEVTAGEIADATSDRELDDAELEAISGGRSGEVWCQ